MKDCFEILWQIGNREAKFNLRKEKKGMQGNSACDCVMVL